MQNVRAQRVPSALAAPSKYRRVNWYARPFFRKKLLPWLFVLPIGFLYSAVVIVPALTGISYALTDWSGMGSAQYIGLENFRTLFFEDDNFVLAFQNNLWWMLIFLTVPFTMALVVSFLLSRIKRGAMLIRTALFVPYVLPSVVVVSIWQNLMSPRKGLGLQISRTFGIDTFNRAYLGNPDTALFAIAFIDNWHFWVFLVVIFLTAMQSISPDLYDAAKIDGASQFHEFIYVTVPSVLPTLVFMLMMVAIWSFLVFDYIYLTTQGGPAGATEVLGTFLYKEAFRRFEAGYASAVGITMSFFAMLIMGFVIFLRRRGVEI